MRSIVLLFAIFLLLGGPVRAPAQEVDPERTGVPAGERRMAPKPEEGRREIAPTRTKQEEQLIRGCQLAEELSPPLATLRTQLADLERVQAAPRPNP